MTAMSQYYKPKRTRNIYDPTAPEPFKVSRSKIDLFVECPQCFYLDRRRGVGRPSGYPFNLNSAVDKLLKKEFDFHRASGTAHPLMEAYGIDAVPYADSRMDEWRENFKGVQFLHEPTNLVVTGAIDDLWKSSDGKANVVDYKATSKETEVTLDADWQQGYKRQMEVYQWLLRRNGIEVDDTGYFVYCNGRTDLEAFDGKLEFDVKIIPYAGNDGWIDDKLIELKACLDADAIPAPGDDCDFCAYREAVADEM